MAEFERFEASAEDEEFKRRLSALNENPDLQRLLDTMEQDCVDSLVTVPFEDHMGRLAFTQRISIIREMKTMMEHADQTYHEMLKRRHRRE